MPASTSARAGHGRAWPVLVALLLGGCAGLPPALPPAPALRSEAPLAGLPTQTDAPWPQQQWWRQFGDAQLDDLIARALANSPGIAAAQARVRAAEALAGVVRAGAAPQVGASASVQRERLSENGLIPPRFLGFTWYTQSDLAAQLRYSLDFWGKQRASLSARVDAARAAAAEAQTVRLTLASAIADAYFAWQAEHAQWQQAQVGVRIQHELAALSNARVQRGLAPEDIATQARLAITDAQTQEVALRGALRTRQAVLAALVGVAPAQLSLAPRPLPQALAQLPADARLNLLGRRPDLLALRWQVEALAQDVRVARSDFLPDISLSAMAGFSSIHASQTLALGSRVFAVGPALSLPLFDGGLLRARYGASVAQLDAAAAQYNQAVLDAAREVAVAVLDFQRLEAQRELAGRALRDSEVLQRQAAARLHQGLTDAAPLLLADAALAAQHARLSALQGQQLASQIALTQALGGGFGTPAVASSATTPTAPTAPEPQP